MVTSRVCEPRTGSQLVLRVEGPVRSLIDWVWMSWESMESWIWLAIAEASVVAGGFIVSSTGIFWLSRGIFGFIWKESPGSGEINWIKSADVPVAGAEKVICWQEEFGWKPLSLAQS